jgi:hypothetical protein
MRSTGQHAVAEHILWIHSGREKNIAQEQNGASPFLMRLNGTFLSVA